MWQYEGKSPSGQRDGYFSVIQALNGNDFYHHLVGDSGQTDISGLRADGSGTLWLYGDSTGKVDGTSGPGKRDLFVVKYDLNNEKRTWVEMIGSSEADHAAAIDVTFNDIYISGNVDGSWGGQSVNGGGDAFLANFNKTGTRT